VLDYENSGLIFQSFLGESPYDVDAQVRASAFTPQLSLLWSPPDSGWSGYLTAAQGFKAGGFNNLAAQGDQVIFAQEDSTTLEAALRWQRGGLRAELVAFATRFDNLQVAVFDGTQFFVDNAAAAQSQGLETALLWRPWPQLKLELAAAALRARYREFRNAPAPAGSASDTQDLSGRTLPRAPRYSGHLGAEYRQPLPGIDLSLGVQAEARSRQFLNLDLDPLHAQGGYLRWDAQMVLRPHRLPVDLVISGQNLGDRLVRREAAAAALFENTRFGSHAAPRTLGVMLRSYWEF
jgi:outer membrane receptor protein involved in Fe transport